MFRSKSYVPLGFHAWLGQMPAVNGPAMRFLLSHFLFLTTSAEPLSAQPTGPAKRALVLVGGGELIGSGILEHFIDLAVPISSSS